MCCVRPFGLYASSRGVVCTDGIDRSGQCQFWRIALQQSPNRLLSTFNVWNDRSTRTPRGSVLIIEQVFVPRYRCSDVSKYAATFKFATSRFPNDLCIDVINHIPLLFYALPYHTHDITVAALYFFSWDKFPLINLLFFRLRKNP